MDAEGQGRDFKLSPTLEPLQDLKDQILVVSNLWNAAANTGDGHYVKESSHPDLHDHQARRSASISACTASRWTRWRRSGRASRRRLPSLELGIEPESTGVDTIVGYTRVYGCAYRVEQSHDTAGAGDQSALRLRAAFPGVPVRRANAAKRHAAARSRAGRRETDARPGGHGRSGADRRVSVDRAFARRADGACERPEAQHLEAAGPIDPTRRPAETPRDHAEHVRLMLDMIALAFQSDTTRICTFMFGNAVSGVNFRFLEGVTDSHHEISHHRKDPEKLQAVPSDQSLARGAVRLSAAQAARHAGRRSEPSWTIR